MNVLEKIGDEFDSIGELFKKAAIWFLIYMFSVGIIGAAVYIKHNSDLRVHFLMGALHYGEIILEYTVGALIILLLITAFCHDVVTGEHLLPIAMGIIGAFIIISVILQYIGFAVSKNFFNLIAIGVFIAFVSKGSLTVVNALTGEVLFSGAIFTSGLFAALMSTVIPYVLGVFGIGVIADAVMSFFY